MKKKYKLINIYIPFLFIISIFIFVVIGILNTEYLDDTEKFTNIYNEINEIPNTENNISGIDYSIYIVSEMINIEHLGEKLGINYKIILYNNPYLLNKVMLQAGDRIVLYSEPVIFYHVRKYDSIESIARKFLVNENEIIKLNPELNNLGIENKKYLLVKNPVINEIDLQSLEKEVTYENVAYTMEKYNDLVLEEKKSLKADYKKSIINTVNQEEKKVTDKSEKNKSNNSDKSIDKMTSNEKIQGKKENIITNKTENRKHELNKYMLWPVSGTTITSGFGNRTHPILKTKKFHRGLDIRVGIGTPLKASFTGIVTYATTKGGYGKLIELERSDGIRVRYAHLDEISVKNGDAVKEGDIIGATGNTGLSTGPHLHFEILVNGEPVNPKTWNYY